MIKFVMFSFLGYFVLLSLHQNVISIARSMDSSTSERYAQITDFRIASTDNFGIFKYTYKTSNGINVQAAGSPLETIGIYSYISPDGLPIEVRYIADKFGFHVVSQHLPKSPPIPDYILRSLEYIRIHMADVDSKQ